MKEKIRQIATQLSHQGIKAYYVGGSVRDELLGVETDDYDICLVGVRDPRFVEDILLKNCASVSPLVGQKFPNWIANIDGVKVDFAMARIETLTGDTRKDFDVVTEGVTIEQDLKRRDLTINSMAKEVLTGELIDPFKGMSCIEFKCLNNTSSAFKEDTLRVLRAARFHSRMPDFYISGNLREMCKSLKPTDISSERVGMELKKAMEQAVKPSLFFRFLREVGWLQYHFEELYNTIGVPQSPDHHPEGDVFEHTMYSLDEAKDWFTRICMVCHDLGKATTTTVGNMNWLDISEDERKYTHAHLNTIELKIKSIGHENETHLTRSMLTRIHFKDHKTVRQIETIQRLHMIRTGVSEKVVRRTLRALMDKGLTYPQLVEVCRCDLSGRPPLAKYTPDIGQHRALMLLETNAMEPIVTGEKLIEVGYTPGKLMGHLVKKGLEWQDRGTLNNENWLKMIKQYKPDKEVSNA
jgi:tRNA nucleotidyltransferase (CCA-adding enzyme)